MCRISVAYFKNILDIFDPIYLSISSRKFRLIKCKQDSFENQNTIPYLSDDVIKPVTSLMSLLSGTVSYHMPSLKSEVSKQGGCFGDFLKHEELSKKRKITKGEHKS